MYVTVHSDHHGASRPARHHSGVPATAAAGGHATRTDHDSSDGGPLHLSVRGHPLLRLHLLLRQTWERCHHHRFPFRVFTSLAYHHRRGTTVNLETAGAFWPSVSSCSICSPAPFPWKPSGWHTSSPNSPGRPRTGEWLHGVQVCPAPNHWEASCRRCICKSGISYKI